MADSNFGIYSVAYHSTQSQHDFLFSSDQIPLQAAPPARGV